VIGLHFNRNNLKGAIPDSLENLQHLRYLFILNDIDDDLNVIHVVCFFNIEGI